MRVRRSAVFPFALVALSLLAAFSCGGGGDDEGAKGPPKEDPPEARGPAGVTGDAGRGADGRPAVSSSGGVRGAVVRIEGSADGGPRAGEGTFPLGSGFFVDPSGVAVTNAHVVTGASDLEVYVGGGGKPLRAEKLGTSECSDLAVLDVEGEGFPYLSFREGEAGADLPVDAAGFPAAGGGGAPPYSQTAGQVTRPEAPGETGAASLGIMVQHDAMLEGGNSGGPLVDEGGRVVGVNFAGPLDERGDATGQWWAIPSDEAREILPALARGEDVGYLGVNGSAFSDARTGLRGVGVAGVEAGSPAEEAGVRGGDVITSLGGSELAREGTMAEYCDVLRAREAEPTRRRPLPIRVRRGGPDGETGEYLEGEIGGGPLRPTGEADRVVADDSGALVARVPPDWARTNGVPTRFPSAGAAADATVRASSDPGRGFSIDAPGMALSASKELAERHTAEGFLDLWSFSEGCREVHREPYDDGTFAGVVDRYAGCGPNGTENTVVAATPQGGEYMAVVNVVTAPGEAGNEARDLVLGSFRVAGEGPERAGLATDR